MRFPSLLTALVCGLPLLAQSATVAGQIVNQAGQPVSKALVNLGPVLPDRRGVVFETDATGKFSFANVDSGRYWLQVRRDGYLEFHFPTQVSLSAGQQLTGLQVKLTPEGIVSGRVLDDDGAPVPTAWVEVLNEKRDVLRSAKIRADGSFVIGQIPPGNFYLSVHDVPEALYSVHDVSGRREGYIETYYPGVTNPAKAAILRVATGAQIRDLNFHISKSVVSCVRGRVVDERGAPVGGSPIELLSLNQGISLVGFAFSDGSFQVLRVPPGDYVVTAARPADQPASATVGHERISVGAGDVDGVVVHLNPILTVSGSLKIEGGGGTGGSRVWLDSPDAKWLRGGQDEVNADGSYQLYVEPGVFFIQASVRPPGTYLKSVLWGGQPQPGNVVDLTRGTQDKTLELTLSPHAAQLNGVVRDAQGVAAVGALLTLRNAGHEIDTDRTGETGAFEFHDLAPGEYQLQVGNEEPLAIALAEDAHATVSLVEANPASGASPGSPRPLP